MKFPTQFYSTNQLKAELNSILRYGFKCVLALLLVWQQSTAVAANRSSLPHETASVFSALDFFETPLISKQHPVKNAPAPWAEETPYENELEEDVENDWNLLPGNSSESISNFFLQGSIFSHSASSAHNRSAVPFFILYHSWKSFLI